MGCVMLLSLVEGQFCRKRGAEATTCRFSWPCSAQTSERVFFSCGRTKDMCWWRLHMTSPMCMMFSSGWSAFTFLVCCQDLQRISRKAGWSWQRVIVILCLDRKDYFSSKLVSNFLPYFSCIQYVASWDKIVLYFREHSSWLRIEFVTCMSLCFISCF